MTTIEHPTNHIDGIIKTKVACTIGPASSSPEMLEALVRGNDFSYRSE
jgi:hypothetical protein